MKSLFEEKISENAPQPLAEKLRPREISDVFGQEHLVGEDGIITNMINSRQIPSIILWGNPGCGKTTIAKLIANKSNLHFEIVSAVSNGAADLKQIFAAAQLRHRNGNGTLLLVDEIHRFNRAQQDLFLPFVENGVITLVGATTENPSFEINSALLSRCKVLTLNPLNLDALEQILVRAEEFYKKRLPVSEEVRKYLCSLADGDGRYLLGVCEDIFALNLKNEIPKEKLEKLLQKRMPLYDKNHDGHYNLISALHKSLRGSDVDAALYWCCRMLDGGEDPMYILRRLVRFAVEDIGVADPNALLQANAAKEAYHFMGSPEGELAIAHLVVYLATAPKSNAVYKAYKASVKDAKNFGSLMPPKHILNAPTKLMKEQGYSDGYIYDHDTPECFSGQDYFPESMGRKSYYNPASRGFEREISKRMEYWGKLRDKYAVR